MRDRRIWLGLAWGGGALALAVHLLTFVRPAPVLGLWPTPVLLVWAVIVALCSGAGRAIDDLPRLLTARGRRSNYWLHTARSAPWWMWAACAAAFWYNGLNTRANFPRLGGSLVTSGGRPTLVKDGKVVRDLTDPEVREWQARFVRLTSGLLMVFFSFDVAVLSSMVAAGQRGTDRETGQDGTLRPEGSDGERELR